MERLKNRIPFLKGRLGLGIIAVVAFIMLTTGSVYAYNFFTATTTVTVAECMTVANTGGDNYEEMAAMQWNPSIDPGSSKSLNLLITNTGTGTLVITASDDCAYTNVTTVWTTDDAGTPGIFGPGESETYTLTVTVLPGATPQDYVFGITISR